ncbi:MULTISPECIES: flagellar basal body rod protein FlgC [unclassified Gilliamella]|uniref:flagellar basal body rod protein FlgC n=1 Tax=unclassified Gilliamella TaxID=2685620 RepID=UPI001C699992|nr:MULTISPECIES: flagellar basal body rod protein FlgC [unclassified Gilliamella]MCX8575064.1 flagellar basal body rod protein FlgC [Gilliamella sp. B3831]MCX8577446.1 flagellar basal body rod protein FlgC [Gilliamella sp. B3815]MCX8579706.1 flagellar basal body rod protein FlgC [Gilliamella sp. B2717]MCX8588423.1 flagellar basal body rod protein FlgC [Gilliamella sp. B3801]MCX8590311.1 flagellar basal body rod protein FlgC [Gilliamella sp. B3812]
MSFSIFAISGSALMAQTQRMNVSASNLANADSITSTSGKAYQAKQVIFQVDNNGEQNSIAGVKVAQVIEDPSPMNLVYEPHHPLADEKGYIQKPNVDVVAEMVNTISASRSYQANVEVINTAKSLMLKTLTLGQ